MKVTLSKVLELAPVVVTLASTIAAVTPNKYDNKVIQILRNLIDFAALNFGSAKNKTPE